MTLPEPKRRRPGTGKTYRKPRGKSRKEIWPSIRASYAINDRATYSSLAREYAVNVDVLRRRAIREGWLADREKYQSQLYAEARSVAARRITTRAADQALDALRDLSRLREAIVATVRRTESEEAAEGKAAAGALPELERRTSVSKVGKDGTSTTIVSRRGSPLADRDFAIGVLKLEIELLRTIFGDRSAGAPSIAAELPARIVEIR